MDGVTSESQQGPFFGWAVEHDPEEPGHVYDTPEEESAARVLVEAIVAGAAVERRKAARRFRRREKRAERRQRRLSPRVRLERRSQEAAQNLANLRSLKMTLDECDSRFIAYHHGVVREVEALSAMVRTVQARQSGDARDHGRGPECSRERRGCRRTSATRAGPSDDPGGDGEPSSSGPRSTSERRGLIYLDKFFQVLTPHDRLELLEMGR